MRGTFRFGPVAMNIETKVPRFEAILASGFAAHFGPFDSSVGPSVEFVDSRQSKTGTVADPPPHVLRLELDRQRPEALPWVMRSLVASLAVPAGGFVVDLPGVISAGRAHLLVGDASPRLADRAQGEGRAVLSPRSVLLYRTSAGTWTAESLVLESRHAAVRRAPIGAIWKAHVRRAGASETVQLACRAQLLCWLLDHVVLPQRTPRVAGLLFELAVELACAVPGAELEVSARGRLWERLDALHAGLSLRQGVVAFTGGPTSGAIGAQTWAAWDFNRPGRRMPKPALQTARHSDHGNA